MENIPDIKQENNLEKYNPNTIGELISVGKDIETSPDKVYRSVTTIEAIDDIENSGVVRNKQSAGLVEKSRWGDRVFWSKGTKGKYHAISKNSFVIEAPLSVAEDRVVNREDITAVYSKNENGEVIDIWKQRREAKNDEKLKILKEKKSRDDQKLEEIRKKLGID